MDSSTVVFLPVLDVTSESPCAVGVIAGIPILVSACVGLLL